MLVWFLVLLISGEELIFLLFSMIEVRLVLLQVQLVCMFSLKLNVYWLYSFMFCDMLLWLLVWVLYFCMVIDCLLMFICWLCIIGMVKLFMFLWNSEIFVIVFGLKYYFRFRLNWIVLNGFSVLLLFELYQLGVLVLLVMWWLLVYFLLMQCRLLGQVMLVQFGCVIIFDVVLCSIRLLVMFQVMLKLGSMLVQVFFSDDRVYILLCICGLGRWMKLFWQCRFGLVVGLLQFIGVLLVLLMKQLLKCLIELLDWVNCLVCIMCMLMLLCICLVWKLVWKQLEWIFLLMLYMKFFLVWLCELLQVLFRQLMQVGQLMFGNMLVLNVLVMLLIGLDRKKFGCVLFVVGL